MKNTYTPAVIAKKDKMIAKLKKAHKRDVFRIHKATAAYLNEIEAFECFKRTIFDMAKVGGHK